MTLQDAETLMARRMAEHGLLAAGWRFEWDRAKRRFGRCSYRSKTLSLSRHLVQLNDATRVDRTVLHEIAHALVGPGHGHNRVWRRQARALGIPGDRCYTVADTVQPEAAGRYVLQCKGCGYKFGFLKRTRYVRRALLGQPTGYFHRSCGPVKGPMGLATD